MNLVSYAQNQEDIVLYRALRGIDKGFYIDVGAQHPVADSVTKLFYERGWHGINIDPVPQWFELLQEDRPHDVNLRLAAGSVAGREKFYAVAGTGLSTADASLVDQYAKVGYAAEELEVETRTLDDICSEYHVGTVHFLKIDVEGFEEDVLRGFSFNKIRPWVVLVEAVAPVAMREGDSTHIPVETHAGWEPILLGHEYEHVYSDGLNRFYVAKEHNELKALLQTPPNPLDAFVRHEELLKHERILQLDARIRELTDVAQVVDQRYQARDFQGLAETAENRLRRIAELEQDNARLIGEASVLQHGAAELNDAHNRVALLVQQNGDLSGRLELQRLVETELRNRLEALELANPQLSGLLSAARLEVIELRKQNNILGERASILERNEHELASQISFATSDSNRLRCELAEQNVRLADLRNELDQAQAALQQMLNSRSWRLTAPLRNLRKAPGSPSQVKGGFSTARDQGKGLPRRMGRRVLLACLRFAQRHPRLHALAKTGYRSVPLVDKHLSAFAQHNLAQGQSDTSPASVAAEPAPAERDLEMPSEAVEVHRRIRRVITDQQRRTD